MSNIYNFNKQQFNSDVSFNNVNTQITSSNTITISGGSINSFGPYKHTDTIYLSPNNTFGVGMKDSTSAYVGYGTSVGKANINMDNVGNTNIEGSGTLNVNTNSGMNIQNDLNVQGTMSHVPTGTIIMYTNSIAPTGFFLCNGSAVSRTTYSKLFSVLGTTYGSGDNSTTFNVPDLRGRSPLGLGQGIGLTNRNLNDKVGSETHTLTTSEMPSHNHTASSAAAGAHSHTASSGAAGSHNHTGNTDYAGTHSHTLTNGDKGTDHSGTYSTTMMGSQFGAAATISVDSGGNHYHPFTTGTVGDHSHTVTVVDGGSHSHSITVGNAGSGSAHNNTHPFIVLNFIIKY